MFLTQAACTSTSCHSISTWRATLHARHGALPHPPFVTCLLLHTYLLLRSRPWNHAPLRRGAVVTAESRAHNGLHHFWHTADFLTRGAVALVLAFGGFASPACSHSAGLMAPSACSVHMMACITSVTLLAYPCVVPSLWFLHSKALHLLPCSHPAWLMAPSACSVHTMACITSVTPLAYPRVAPSL